jgi:hypothetical protein
MRAIILLATACAWAAFAAEEPVLVRFAEHTGMCDASAGVALTEELFLAVNDEDNTLRIYRNDGNGSPVAEWRLDVFLQVQGNFLEADLEGAAEIGNRIFIIGSHGLNREGKERFNRHRFFAVDVVTNRTGVTLSPVGSPCKTLLDQLLRDPRVGQFKLSAAATRAPKEPNALNIEGLADTPEGHLLLCFRNPVPEGKALLIPLINPQQVIGGQAAIFGDPIRLDLGGLGIRDIARWQERYFMIAGPYHGGGPFQFFIWKGPGHNPKRIKTEKLGDLHPEAVVIYPERGLREVQILCDDGNRLIYGKPCKQLRGLGKFRSMWLDFHPEG